MTDYLVTARARVSALTEHDAARMAREHIARDEIHVRVDVDEPNGTRSGVTLPAAPENGACATEGCERPAVWVSVAEALLHPDDVRRCRVCCDAIGEAFERLTATPALRGILVTRLNTMTHDARP